MEVHHHPHVGKKEWKEYITEGLMIFFAVTMGFFAEQFREYMVERKHEKELMHQIVKDLKNDQVTIKGLKEWYAEDVFPAGDSIKYFMTHSKSVDDNSLYVNFRHVVRYMSINSWINNRTYIKLKNNEGFEMISNKAVTDSIMHYYGYIEKISDLETYMFQEKQDLRQMLHLFLDGEMYDQVVNEKDEVVRPKGHLYAKKYTDQQKNELLIRLSDINGLSRNLLNRIKYLEKESEQLASYIEKSYDLK
jgi:hypothetical protein